MFFISYSVTAGTPLYCPVPVVIEMGYIKILSEVCFINQDAGEGKEDVSVKAKCVRVCAGVCACVRVWVRSGGHNVITIPGTTHPTTLDTMDTQTATNLHPKQ